jgi:hypothetical protein|tara:strand:+ start:7217 stop:7438 length:222 start_codon:yes stop_codon:yes gene_type:complete
MYDPIDPEKRVFEVGHVVYLEGELVTRVFRVEHLVRPLGERLFRVGGVPVVVVIAHVGARWCECARVEGGAQT